jgi:hypothetical protein
MRKDPLTEWEEGFPYDLLAPVGVTPDSPMAVVREALFLLMARGTVPAADRQAWEALRRPERRRVVDFFMLPGDAQPAPEPAPRRRKGEGA